MGWSKAPTVFQSGMRGNSNTGTSPIAQRIIHWRRGTLLKCLHLRRIKNTSLIGLGWLRSIGSPRTTPTWLFKVSQVPDRGLSSNSAALSSDTGVPNHFQPSQLHPSFPANELPGTRTLGVGGFLRLAMGTTLCGAPSLYPRQRHAVSG